MLVHEDVWYFWVSRRTCAARIRIVLSNMNTCVVGRSTGGLVGQGCMYLNPLCTRFTSLSLTKNTCIPVVQDACIHVDQAHVVSG